MRSLRGKRRLRRVLRTEIGSTQILSDQQDNKKPAEGDMNEVEETSAKHNTQETKWGKKSLSRETD